MSWIDFHSSYQKTTVQAQFIEGTIKHSCPVVVFFVGQSYLKVNSRTFSNRSVWTCFSIKFTSNRQSKVSIGYYLYEMSRRKKKNTKNRVAKNIVSRDQIFFFLFTSHRTERREIKYLFKTKLLYCVTVGL